MRTTKAKPTVTVSQVVTRFYAAAVRRYDMDYWHIEDMLTEAARARGPFNPYGDTPIYTRTQARLMVEARVHRCDDPLEACCELVAELCERYMRTLPPGARIHL